MNSSDIKRRAVELSEKTNSETISPQEVGGIMYDTVSYMEDVQRNSGSLGIRKTYTSVSAMEADKNPKDSEGNPLKKGMLVNIYNPANASDPDNNKVYAYNAPGWVQTSKLDAGYATKAEINELNISNLYPTNGEGGTNKYTLETAIAQVPAEYRVAGLKVSFINESSNTESWEFLGGDWVGGRFKEIGYKRIDDLDKKTTVEVSKINGKIDSYEQINYELTIGLDGNNDYIYFEEPLPAFYLLGLQINSFENPTLDNLAINCIFTTGGSINCEIALGEIKYTQPTQPYDIKGLSIFSSGVAMGKKLNFSLILPSGINIANIKQNIKFPITDNFTKDVPQILDAYPKGSSFYLSNNFTSTRFSNYQVYAIFRTKAELENVTTPSAGLAGGGTINGNGHIIKGALFEVTGDYSFENCIFESCCIMINSVLGKIKFKAKNCIFLNSSIEHNIITSEDDTDYIYPISLDVQDCEFSYTDDYNRSLTYLLRGVLVENSIIANNRFYNHSTKNKPRNILMFSCVNSLFINNSFDGGVTGILFMGQDTSSKLAKNDGMYIVANNKILYNRFVNIEEEIVTFDHGGRRAIKTSINTCTIISKTIEQLIEGNNQREFCRKATIKLKVADQNFIHRVGCVMSVLLKDDTKDYSTIREITRNEGDTDYTLFDVVTDSQFFYYKYYTVVRDLPTQEDGVTDGILISVPYINNLIMGNTFITDWAAIFFGGCAFGNNISKNHIIGSGHLVMLNVNNAEVENFPHVTRGININNNICPDSDIRLVDFNKWSVYAESQGLTNLSSKTISDVIITENYYNAFDSSNRDLAENVQSFANIARSGYELPS